MTAFHAEGSLLPEEPCCMSNLFSSANKATFYRIIVIIFLIIFDCTLNIAFSSIKSTEEAKFSPVPMAFICSLFFFLIDIVLAFYCMRNAFQVRLGYSFSSIIMFLFLGLAITFANISISFCIFHKTRTLIPLAQRVLFGLCIQVIFSSIFFIIDFFVNSCYFPNSLPILSALTVEKDMQPKEKSEFIIDKQTVNEKPVITLFRSTILDYRRLNIHEERFEEFCGIQKKYVEETFPAFLKMFQNDTFMSIDKATFLRNLFEHQYAGRVSKYLDLLSSYFQTGLFRNYFEYTKICYSLLISFEMCCNKLATFCQSLECPDNLKYPLQSTYQSIVHTITKCDSVRFNIADRDFMLDYKRIYAPVISIFTFLYGKDNFYYSYSEEKDLLLVWENRRNYGLILVYSSNPIYYLFNFREGLSFTVFANGISDEHIYIFPLKSLRYIAFEGTLWCLIPQKSNANNEQEMIELTFPPMHVSSASDSPIYEA